jgi:hypothetical protein
MNNKYLDQTTVQNAYKKGTGIGCYISILANHGVCGSCERNTIRKLVSFLQEKNINFEGSLPKGLIWLPSLEQTILQILRKN